MKIIGITGGIASGKSAVTKMLAQQGAVTRSADNDAREVVAPNSPTLAAVLQAFPEAKNSDGTLNRAALGKRIFADPEARAHLEAITHPAIIARMEGAIQEARSDHREGVLVYEVPLLYEAGLEGLFDAVIAVLATPALQAERLQAREAAAGRPPLPSEAVAQRLASQIAPEEKARRADYVIRTNTTLEATGREVERVWKEISEKQMPGYCSQA